MNKAEINVVQLPTHAADLIREAVHDSEQFKYPADAAQMAAFPMRLEPIITSLDPYFIRGCGSLRDTWNGLSSLYSTNELFETTIASFHASVGLAKTLLNNGTYARAMEKSDSEFLVNRSVESPFFNRNEDYSPATGKAFVLMPFTEEWSSRIWEDHIKIYVEESGFECSRADDLNGPDVMSDVYHQIVTSQVVIADISGRNANVMYEIGICHGLNKDVLLLTQNVTDIPFDLQRFRHCIYKDNSDGYRILRTSLNMALNGRSNNRNNN